MKIQEQEQDIELHIQKNPLALYEEIPIFIKVCLI